MAQDIYYFEDFIFQKDFFVILFVALCKDISWKIKISEELGNTKICTKTRGIPSDTVNELMKRHLLYQDERGNCVFTNETGDVAEIRGTNSYRPYKSTRRTRAGGFFWLMNEPSEYYRKHVETVYVCESAKGRGKVEASYEVSRTASCPKDRGCSRR